MSNLLRKELKLATSALSWIFLAFTLMTFIPGYPILMGSFFVSLGIFQSFHQTRVTNDVLYTALLPVKKGDVVRSKYTVVCFFEVVGMILFAVFSAIRMTALKDEIVYRENYMMNANLVFLGFCLLLFLMFNLIFVRGFFKTAYNINKSYLFFVISALIVIMVGEGLHFIPPLSFLNDNLGEGSIVSASASTTIQVVFFVICLILFVLGTLLAYKGAKKRFIALDL